jgi:hypothetical protein
MSSLLTLNSTVSYGLEGRHLVFRALVHNVTLFHRLLDEAGSDSASNFV